MRPRQRSNYFEHQIPAEVAEAFVEAAALTDAAHLGRVEAASHLDLQAGYSGRPMPPPEPPAWAALAIVALCGLNMAIGIFEVVLGRPWWWRRLLSPRGRLPATARDWRLHDVATSLAAGGVMLLTIGQGLIMKQTAPLRTSSAPVFLVLAMGLVAVLMLVVAVVAFLQVKYRPRPGSGHRP